MSFLIDNWRGKPISPEGVFGSCTDVPVKLFRVWFASDLQLVKTRDEGMNIVARLNHNWAEMMLSLKGRAKVENANIASVIIYRLTVVPCPNYCLNKLEGFLFIFLWERLVLGLGGISRVSYRCLAA